MTNSPIIADTGFWVALLNRADRHHGLAVKRLSGLKRRLVSTWPVLTETCHLLVRRGGVNAQHQFVASWVRSDFDVYSLDSSHAPRIEALMIQYRSLPMDLADASLVILAETLRCGDIFSTDQRDFGACRWKQRKPFTNLLLTDEA
ncbi:MAG: type II toxin-antitoxin system VapC family toxin [Gammaproteobacteria bacterium]